MDSDPKYKVDTEKLKRDIRREHATRRLLELCGGSLTVLGKGEVRPELLERMLRSLEALCAPRTTRLIDHLRKMGINVPAPSRLQGGKLRAKLWEIIRGLAAQKAFLFSTNHLTDRELYEALVERMLEMPATAGDGEWTGEFHWDFLEDDADGTALYLRYYASPKERREWRRDFPEDPMPRRKEPPSNRDRRLPKPARSG